MRQELPSGPTGDIDGEPPRAHNTPSARLLGHLILISKPRATAALSACGVIAFGNCPQASDCMGTAGDAGTAWW
jgi:hypothetical protein